MATLNSTVYHPDQWKLVILPETTVGTKLVTSMHLLDIDKPITITEAPFIAHNPRLGTGRTLKETDAYVQPNGQVKSISCSGIADTTTFPILAENCIGIEEASGTIDIAVGYTGGQAVELGADNSVGTTNTYTLTVALVSPMTDKSRVLPGCIVDELSWVDDVTAEGGRRRFNTTFLSRSVLEEDATDPTYTNSDQLYSTYYSVYDYLKAQQLVDSDEVALAKLEVALKSNVRFHGFTTNGQPEIMTRGLPTVDVSGSVDVKYDINTQPNIQAFAANTSIALGFRDNAVLASATTGLEIAKAKITGDVNLSAIDEGAFITIPWMAVADTSGSLAQIPV